MEARNRRLTCIVEFANCSPTVSALPEREVSLDVTLFVDEVLMFLELPIAEWQRGKEESARASW